MIENGLMGTQALTRLLEIPGINSVLDIGSGAGAHAKIMRDAGRDVTTISLSTGADYVGDFLGWPSNKCDFDAVWACHVLEHQVNPGAFLSECKRRLRPGGFLAVTVPPSKREIVGGHVTLWNAGLLLYQLILAGFDCRNARVGTYDYNISVIVQNESAKLPELACDVGDIERLAQFFPMPVAQGFDGELPDIGWTHTLQDAAPESKHVAILGLGPSLEQYQDMTKRLGGRSKFCDEVWAINALGDVFACDLVFHMDDVRIQEIRAKALPDSNIAALLVWLKTSKVPVVTSRAHSNYPALVEFPLEDVLNNLGHDYFNSTAAYAVAFAIHTGATEISCFGMDYSYSNTHQAEKGRACVEFWLGQAHARGVKINLPKTTSLMDSCHDKADRLYGYDTQDVIFDIQADGAVKLSFKERASLPTAAEIEASYDHSAKIKDQHLKPKETPCSTKS